MNLEINLVLNGEKLSMQFLKTLKKLLEENQSDSSNLLLLGHQLLKNDRTLGIEEMNSKEIYSIINLSKLILKKKFLSIVFNGKTYTHFRVKSL